MPTPGTLAALNMIPNARAQKFPYDVEERVHDLDTKFPSSTLTQVLKAHGTDGIYLVLVVGSFAHLSDDFMISWLYVTFLNVLCALTTINSRNMHPKQALASNRYVVTQKTNKAPWLFVCSCLKIKNLRFAWNFYTDNNEQTTNK